jgi:hypothetical protein
MVYSGILTVVFSITLFTAFTQSGKQRFKELDVQRINLVEPDGTSRLVISNKALAPGIIIKGQEHPHPDRKTAGMIFFNDEGTENGGLIFGGEKGADGTERSSGHLSFDRCYIAPSKALAKAAGPVCRLYPTLFACGQS